MRFHDIPALAGLIGLAVGLVLVVRPGHRPAGGLLALVSLAVLAYGASFL